MHLTIWNCHRWVGETRVSISSSLIHIIHIHISISIYHIYHIYIYLSIISIYISTLYISDLFVVISRLIALKGIFLLHNNYHSALFLSPSRLPSANAPVNWSIILIRHTCITPLFIISSMTYRLPVQVTIWRPWAPYINTGLYCLTGCRRCWLTETSLEVSEQKCQLHVSSWR